MSSASELFTEVDIDTTDLESNAQSRVSTQKTDKSVYGFTKAQEKQPGWKLNQRTIEIIVLSLTLALAAVIGLVFALRGDDEDGGNNNNAVNLAAEANPTDTPTAAPIDLGLDVEIPTGSPNGQCPFGEDFDIRGDGSLLLRQIVHDDTMVTVQLEFDGEAWLGFAFNENGVMAPNTAMIGIPQDGSVAKYDLQARATPPLVGDNGQTLEDTSIIQQDGKTFLTFTKLLEEEGEVSAVAGNNQFLWAIGFSNNFGIHQFKGVSNAPFAVCGAGGVQDEETEAPTASPTAPPTSSPTDSPTASPTASPTNSPTSPPTQAKTEPPQVTLAPTAAPVNFDYPVGETGTWSKKGNRRSCSIDVCPSGGWSGVTQTAAGCECEDGLDLCWWDGEPVYTETFSGSFSLQNSAWDGVYKLAAWGSQLNLGQGGDNASGVDCYDDPLRGGFRVDLTGTDYVFSEFTKVWVSGYSPTMRLKADGVVVDTVRSYATMDNLELWVPGGTKVVEVDCGGWPADCNSDIFISLA